MIAFLGDLHGESIVLEKILEKIYDFPEITHVIQVGDFGFYPGLIPNFYQVASRLPIYAIDGNHEHFPMLRGIDFVTEFATNIFYVPRGTVLEIDGRKIGFCGGAASVDKKDRIANFMGWFPDEEVTDEDIAKFDDVATVDILVTHCPPQSIIQKHLNPHNLLWFGLPVTWRDPSADRIERLWERMGKPQLISGHLHHRINDGTCRVLDIAELFAM